MGMRVDASRCHRPWAFGRWNSFLPPGRRLPFFFLHEWCGGTRSARHWTMDNGQWATHPHSACTTTGQGLRAPIEEPRWKLTSSFRTLMAGPETKWKARREGMLHCTISRFCPSFQPPSSALHSHHHRQHRPIGLLWGTRDQFSTRKYKSDS
jgi:hypothetical protein